MIKSKISLMILMVSLMLIAYIGITHTLALNSESINWPKKKEYISPSNNNKNALLIESGFNTEVAEWFAARGNFNFSKREFSYEEMTNDKLKALSDQGDLRAFDILSTRYLSDPKYLQSDFKAYIDLNWLSATYGSTKALTNLAIIQDSIAMTKSPTEEDKKNNLILTLAYLNVQERRGDLMGKLVIAPMYENQRRTALTEEDKAAIVNKAEQIYVELQQKRTELRLGDFDNSVPSSVKLFFNLMAQSK